VPGGGMNFELTDDQELIRRSVAELARKFDDQYWMEKDQAHEFPAEFYKAMADGGWLGMTIPTQYGGHGLGIGRLCRLRRGARAVVYWSLGVIGI
jgi:acyl-CoA dehydrogenase